MRLYIACLLLTCIILSKTVALPTPLLNQPPDDNEIEEHEQPQPLIDIPEEHIDELPFHLPVLNRILASRLHPSEEFWKSGQEHNYPHVEPNEVEHEHDHRELRPHESGEHYTGRINKYHEFGIDGAVQEHNYPHVEPYHVEFRPNGEQEHEHRFEPHGEHENERRFETHGKHEHERRFETHGKHEHERRFEPRDPGRKHKYHELGLDVSEREVDMNRLKKVKETSQEYMNDLLLDQQLLMDAKFLEMKSFSRDDPQYMFDMNKRILKMEENEKMPEVLKKVIFSEINHVIPQVLSCQDIEEGTIKTGLMEEEMIKSRLDCLHQLCSEINIRMERILYNDKNGVVADPTLEDLVIILSLKQNLTKVQMQLNKMNKMESIEGRNEMKQETTEWKKNMDIGVWGEDIVSGFDGGFVGDSFDDIRMYDEIPHLFGRHRGRFRDRRPPTTINIHYFYHNMIHPNPPSAQHPSHPTHDPSRYPGQTIIDPTTVNLLIKHHLNHSLAILHNHINYGLNYQHDWIKNHTKPNGMYHGDNNDGYNEYGSESTGYGEQNDFDTDYDPNTYQSGDGNVEPRQYGHDNNGYEGFNKHDSNQGYAKTKGYGYNNYGYDGPNSYESRDVTGYPNNNYNYNGYNGGQGAYDNGNSYGESNSYDGSNNYGSGDDTGYHTTNNYYNLNGYNNGRTAYTNYGSESNSYDGSGDGTGYATSTNHDYNQNGYNNRYGENGYSGSNTYGSASTGYPTDNSQGNNGYNHENGQYNYGSDGNNNDESELYGSESTGYAAENNHDGYNLERDPYNNYVPDISNSYDSDSNSYDGSNKYGNVNHGYDSNDYRYPAGHNQHKNHGIGDFV